MDGKNGKSVDTRGIDPRVTRLILIVSVLFSLSALALLGFKTLTYYTGPILLDEWYCGGNDAPATMSDGSSSCFPEGSDLPNGYTWDPLGNRPFECDSRYGWEPIVEDETGEQDCMKAEEPLTLPPDGYRYVNWEIRSAS